ncbi:hypothetical protein CRENPOLYSF2_1250009 [Crenothrix polyspora]|uniref:Uncharacterized protein n=1 Tax=Crenothrix polyspora TaxID=360316 RepID=A0A1R4H069_9GAMM|nr:hypothetical protein CRENPOLYSF2_1250009 [Crenothrix polyspora]
MLLTRSDYTSLKSYPVNSHTESIAVFQVKNILHILEYFTFST